MTPCAQLPNNPDVPASNETILRRLFPKLASLVDSYDGRWSASVHVHATRSGLPTITVENGPTMLHSCTAAFNRWLRPRGGSASLSGVSGILPSCSGWVSDTISRRAGLERRPLCRISS